MFNNRLKSCDSQKEVKKIQALLQHNKIDFLLRSDNDAWSSVVINHPYVFYVKEEDYERANAAIDNMKKEERERERKPTPKNVVKWLFQGLLYILLSIVQFICRLDIRFKILAILVVLNFIIIKCCDITGYPK